MILPHSVPGIIDAMRVNVAAICSIGRLPDEARFDGLAVRSAIGEGRPHAGDPGIRLHAPVEEGLEPPGAG